MANKNTKRNRVTRDGYKAKTGVCINSTEARKASGRKPYSAPTRNTGGAR
jgi:hypothetical protein